METHCHRNLLLHTHLWKEFKWITRQWKDTPTCTSTRMQCPWRPEKSIRSLWTKVQMGSELLCGWWESDLIQTSALKQPGQLFRPNDYLLPKYMTDIIHSVNKSNPDTPLGKKRGWRDGSAVRTLAVFPEALSPPQGHQVGWTAGSQDNLTYRMSSQWLQGWAWDNCYHTPPAFP